MALILTQAVKDGPFHLTVEGSGEYIVIDVIEVQGQQCRISIEAPDNVIILRDKIWLQNHQYDGGNS